MLQPLFKKRAKTLNNVRQNYIPSPEAKDMCRSANKNLKDAIAVAQIKFIKYLNLQKIRGKQ